MENHPDFIVTPTGGTKGRKPRAPKAPTIPSIEERVTIGPGVPPTLAPTLAALVAAVECGRLLVARSEYKGQDCVVLSMVAGETQDEVAISPLAVLLDHTALQGHIRPLQVDEIAERDGRDAAEAERQSRRGYL